MRLLAKHPTKKFGGFSNYHGIGNYGPRPYLESSLSRVTQRLCHAKSLYNSGRVVQQAPLELWANVKQRALDQALGEINKYSDIWSWNSPGGDLIGRLLSLGFRITARKHAKR